MTRNFAQRKVSRQAKFRRLPVQPGSALRDSATMAGPTYALHVHLKAWRRFVGLTQEQVANKLDLAPSTLSGWENGGRTVDLDDLKVLADIYGVDPSLLLHAPPGTPKLKALTEISAIFDRMTPEAISDLLKIAGRLTDKQ